jgi:hypothetical protein
MEVMVDARCVSALYDFAPCRYPWFVVVVSMGGWQGALTCGGACGCSGESALGAVDEATAEAAKHGDRNEALAALVVQARVVEAERATAAAEEAAVKVRL